MPIDIRLAHIQNFSILLNLKFIVKNETFKLVFNCYVKGWKNFILLKASIIVSKKASIIWKFLNSEHNN
jgi:hypothetical protein